MDVKEFIEKHARGRDRWICYCEAMIARDGTIYEAVPSHQQFLIREAVRTLGVTKAQLWDGIGPAYSPVHLLAQVLGFVPIWYRFGIASREDMDNPAVLDTVMALQEAGLLPKAFGFIPNRELDIFRERTGFAGKTPADFGDYLREKAA